jgi:hypothetical protein
LAGSKTQMSRAIDLADAGVRGRTEPSGLGVIVPASLGGSDDGAAQVVDGGESKDVGGVAGQRGASRAAVLMRRPMASSSAGSQLSRPTSSKRPASASKRARRSAAWRAATMSVKARFHAFETVKGEMCRRGARPYPYRRRPQPSEKSASSAWAANPN